MPYIKAGIRDRLEDAIQSILCEVTLDKDIEGQKDGVLNYIISTLVKELYGRDGWSYKKINDAIGTIECAKLEFYRRVAVPYENEKISLNGDVYDRKAA